MAEIIHLLTGLGDDIQAIHKKHQGIVNILNTHYKKDATVKKSRKKVNKNEYVPSYQKDLEEQRVRATMEKNQIKQNRKNGGNYEIAGNDMIGGNEEIGANYVIASGNKRSGQRKVNGSGFEDLLEFL